MNEPGEARVAVIGAGQAGLSVAFHLARLGLRSGVDTIVLDRGPSTGGAWQHRWASLRIGTTHHINDLPGMDALGLSFDTADRSRPARDVVAEYYREYERHYDLGVVRPASVSAVTDRNGRLAVEFEQAEPGVRREVSVEVVVNASGTWGTPFLPWVPGRDTFRGRQLRTPDYVSAREFAGLRVVVVGGGTSAIGFLRELESVASDTLWVTRRPVEFLDEGEFDLEARVAAVRMQDEAARAGRALPSIVRGTGIPNTREIAAARRRGLLVAEPMFDSIDPDGVRWADGRVHAADAIIWATGFRPEVRHLAPLRLREPDGGIQVQNGVSVRDPRIFFAGYGPGASTIGANRAGRIIARQVIARLDRG